MIPGHLPPPPPAPARDLSASPTSSRTVTETVKGSHKFVIQGYSLTKGVGVGRYIASDAFSVGGYQWMIYFFPDGIHPEDNALYVSVYIGLVSEGTDVRARALFELVLVDQSGKGRHLAHSQPLTLVYGRSMWGYRCLYERTALETSDFLRDDCLKINCTVGVVVSRRDSSQQHLVEVPDPDIGSHIAMLLEDREGSDVVVDVAGEKFHAHKLVLAARSPVFKAKFFDELNDGHGEIAITDMEPEVFKAMLHYIYKDTLVGDDVLLAASRSSVSSVSDTLAAKLFAAADKYDLGRLRQLCESYLCKYISIDSVSTILAFADQHHATELKAVCLQFSADNLAGTCFSFYLLYSIITDRDIMSLAGGNHTIFPLWAVKLEVANLCRPLITANAQITDMFSSKYQVNKKVDVSQFQIYSGGHTMPAEVLCNANSRGLQFSSPLVFLLASSWGALGSSFSSLHVHLQRG